MLEAKVVTLLLLLTAAQGQTNEDGLRRHQGQRKRRSESDEQSYGHRHHKDRPHVFSCGEFYYRTFYMDTDKDILYVGGMDKVFALSLANVNTTNCANSLTIEPLNVARCVAKGKSEVYDCKNHIRIIQPIGDGSRFYVCGTNAFSPMDWVVHANLSHVDSWNAIPGIGNGVAKCPFDPDDNATAVWVEKGNPGQLAGLYSGTVAEFSKADAVIFRTNLYDSHTNLVVYPFKRTVKYDSKWLDKPNFVGAYDIGDHVYFFFRENAVEHINCGKTIYSRVARVCKRDTGGKNILYKNWASFVKARLNCSIPGEFPFYFSEIQSVYKLPNDNSRVFAIFSTSMNGLIGSAICTFSLSSIEEALNGKFKEQTSSLSAWLPVLTSKVPEPRPGSCVNDTQTLPDAVLNFIRSHPLADSAVTHDNRKPLFYAKDVVFRRIVVQKLEVDGVHYTIFYAGTKTGFVYKLVEWYDGTGQAFSNLIDVYDVTAPEPIQAMEISSKHNSMYVASDSAVRQVSLLMCRSRHPNCVQCVRDPYCGWDKDHKVCKPYVRGLLQDITGATKNICSNRERRKTLQLHWGQSVHLPCPIRQRQLDVLRLGPVQWYHYRHDKGKYQIMPQKKYVQTSDLGLVIMSMSEDNSGRYDCKLGDTTLCSYNVTIHSQSCNSPSQNEYKKVYSDWCVEFEKYKTAMKLWQNNQMKCQSPHPNDVTYLGDSPHL
ncbi:semaphorin-2A-like isoform X1 [Tachypleus tridentatus]|uniref:semaphorin-2A-like isoform X1 n=2 Tax=Tachypleus tridentatus TaxID=6853 RepID=UPI003FCF137C